VRGVGEQREGTEEEAADELDDQEERVEDERKRQRLRALVGEVARMVVPVTMPRAVVVVVCRTTTVPPGKQC
jgi:hypothetical protein